MFGLVVFSTSTLDLGSRISLRSESIKGSKVSLLLFDNRNVNKIIDLKEVIGR